MLQIAICDDCEQDRTALSALLVNTPGCRRTTDLAVRHYESGEQLLFAAEDEETRFDLIFLDIYMAGINGMETARGLRRLGINAPLVFLTSSPNFAVESYDVEAAGYLLKPPSAEKVAHILEKILAAKPIPRLAVKSDGRRRQFAYDDILYLESADKVVLIHLTDGTQACCRDRLNALEEILRDRRFLRCHQSYLVNMDHVKSAGKEFLMSDGSIVPIRIHGRREIADVYYSYFVSDAVSKLPGEEDAYV